MSSPDVRILFDHLPICSLCPKSSYVKTCQKPMSINIWLIDLYVLRWEFKREILVLELPLLIVVIWLRQSSRLRTGQLTGLKLVLILDLKWSILCPYMMSTFLQTTYLCMSMFCPVSLLPPTYVQSRTSFMDGPYSSQSFATRTSSCAIGHAIITR